MKRSCEGKHLLFAGSIDDVKMIKDLLGEAACNLHFLEHALTAEELMGQLSCGEYISVLIDDSVEEHSGVCVRIQNHFQDVPIILLKSRQADICLDVNKISGDCVNSIHKDDVSWHALHAMLSLVYQRNELRKTVETLKHQLSESHKIIDLSNMAAGICHEFCNMLTVVTGSTSYLLETLPKDDPIYNDIENIYKAASNAVKLSRQLLQMRTSFKGEPDNVHINEHILQREQILRIAMKGESVLQLKLDAGNDLVLADPSHIDQILLNLVINARDAVLGKGSVTITTGNEGTGDVSMVCMSVINNGVHINKAVMARMFEPGFTTKPEGKGTGFGLYVIKQIVESYHGRIEVESDEGKDTRFSVYLPCRGLREQTSIIDHVK